MIMKDIRAAMDAVRRSELNRDEDEEWEHIRMLQRERDARLSRERSC
jgi:hypothetical protein